MIALALLVGWLLGRAGGAEEPLTPPMSESGNAGDSAGSEQRTDSESTEQSDAPAGFGLASFSHVQGRSTTEDGYPVSFPRTPEGGVSMVVAYLRWISSNSSQRLASVMGTYHDRDADITPEVVQDEILSPREEEISTIASNNGMYFNRESFPEPGSTFEINPIGVAWWDEGEDSVDVYVLVDEQFYISMGENYIRRYAYRHTIEWNPAIRGGDWLITETRDLSAEQFHVPGEEELHLDHPYWTPVAGSQPYDYGLEE
jgi:hypothetical protein